jgi:hypothetical protein
MTAHKQIAANLCQNTEVRRQARRFLAAATFSGRLESSHGLFPQKNMFLRNKANSLRRRSPVFRMNPPNMRQPATTSTHRQALIQTQFQAN